MTTATIDLLVEHLAEVTAARISDLVDLGLSASTVRRLRRQGLLVDLGPAVVGLRAEKNRFRQRCVAGLLLHPGAVLSHQSAATVYGVGVVDDSIHLTGAPGSQRSGADNVLHRTSLLRARDQRVVRGLALTSPARTVCDLAAVLAEDHYRWLTRRLVRDGFVAAHELLASDEILAAPGRPGVASRRRVFAELFGDDLPIAETVLEEAFRDLIAAEGLPGLVMPFEPEWFDGRYGVVDAALPAVKVIIELDGRRWHGALEDFENDRARDRVAAERGWRVLRFTWTDVVERPWVVVDSLRAVLGGL